MNKSRLILMILILIFIISVITLIRTVITAIIKQKNEKEMSERLLYLRKNNIPLSGVELEYRSPNKNQILNKVFDIRHVSLKIVDKKTGKVRKVGLGYNGPFLKSEFTLHYYYDNSIPIECWVDYKKKIGHFPGELNPIDIDKLNQLTKTREECSHGESIYSTLFGFIITGIDGGKNHLNMCIKHRARYF